MPTTQSQRNINMEEARERTALNNWNVLHANKKEISNTRRLGHRARANAKANCKSISKAGFSWGFSLLGHRCFWLQNVCILLHSIMAFCMSSLHLVLPSGSRMTLAGPRWRCNVTPLSTKLRHLYTSTIAAPNHSHFFPSVNTQTRSGCVYLNRQSSFYNAVNLVQRTEANLLHAVYPYQSNAAGIRRRIFPMLQVHRNYSEGTPESPKSADSKLNATSSSAAAGEGSGNAVSSSATVQSSSQRIKVFLKEYGTVGMVFHISMSLCVLSVCYLLVSK